MKTLLFLLLAITLGFSLEAQYTVCTTAPTEDSHLAVSINTSTANADISILLGGNLNNKDFSVSFTDDISQADVIITDNALENDLIIVKSRLSDANLSVIYGDNLINPDVSIELIEHGTVDFLVYNQSASFDIESLLMALLPIINAHLEYKYDVIPFWGSEGENAADEAQEEQEDQVLEPTYYAGINLAHWISSIEDGIIQLDDNSIFYVYDEDRYISNLWQKTNDVTVTPTEVSGHYHITKDGGIYKEAETLRAICIKGL